MKILTHHGSARRYPLPSALPRESAHRRAAIHAVRPSATATQGD